MTLDNDLFISRRVVTPTSVHRLLQSQPVETCFPGGGVGVALFSQIGDLLVLNDRRTAAQRREAHTFHAAQQWGVLIEDGTYRRVGAEIHCDAVEFVVRADGFFDVADAE